MYQVLLAASTLAYGGLCDGLASPDYRVRERAQAALTAASPLAWPALAEAARCSDAEKSRRAADVLDRRLRLPPNAADCVGVLFLLGRPGSPYLAEWEEGWLREHGERYELFKQLCVNLGLCRTADAMEAIADHGGFVAVMRGRAMRNPLPYPDDPLGPKK